MPAPRLLRGPDLERAKLIDAVVAERERLAAEIVTRLRAEMDCYSTLPADDLIPVTRRNLELVFRIVRDRRDELTQEERDWFVEAGAVRSRQGLPVADVLRGWRFGTDVIWESLAEFGRDRGVGDDILLDLMRETARAVDPAIVAFVTGHHRAELERVRHEDHVRGELVQRVLRGLLAGSELREQCAVWGLDPDRHYVTFRARPTSSAPPRELERLLGLAPVKGQPPQGLATVLDGDLAGFAERIRHRAVPTQVGVGPAAPLDRLEPSFRLATRAFATAAAFGFTGVFDLDGLGLRAAVVADPEVGERLVRRYIEPIRQGAARSAEALLEAIERYLACGLRAEAAAAELNVHPNTLRYRLSRFEQLTGADLHDIAVVAEVWWALQRSRQHDPFPESPSGDFGDSPETVPSDSVVPP
jgi:PucR C-terminal helix-turn-helix domain